MTRTHSRSVGAMLVVAVALAGCTVGPDYVAPEPDLPDLWHQDLIGESQPQDQSLHSWWTVLSDPVLEGLIQRAAQNNLELEQAFARLRQARAERGIATGLRYPDLDAFGDATRTRASEGVLPAAFGGGSTVNSYSLGIDLNYEIDVWGRVSRSIESADASLQASVENYRDVLVLVQAEVALNYVETRALQARIAFAEANAESQRGTLKLTQDRFNAQISPELDVRQAELNLAATESAVPALEQGLAARIHRISVLLGEPPGALFDELAAPVPIPDPTPTIAVGLPANLLRQRPDIRAAERNLAAQTAQIGVATAALYPQFSLGGFFGLKSVDTNLFESGNTAWSVALPVRWNLFNGGAVRNNIKLQEERTAELLIVWEQTVLLALEEVENALVGYAKEIERRDFLAAAVAAAQRSAELVRTLYTTGLTDFQNVLDMERSLTAQQDLLAESQGLVTQNLILLYRALGGGWDPDASAPASSATDS